ncbi:uncharacterized protein SRS1_10784 [Sporisorium reilianum f. sp. reilianum]|uniref:Uncharacterized protein n=1 Tax=Sporisorium reilianum f. sp. reilianum TaxID=72559 RepID=A0A2N8UC67_9BASI|nr:uncharacterized protein SRS1_10784 [Sporisorium reilianum f. sp. reilianum]
MERREALMAQQTGQQTGRFKDDINSKTLPVDLANPHVWTVYLHMYALQGKGRASARGRNVQTEALQASGEQDDYDGQNDEDDGYDQSHLRTQASQHATPAISIDDAGAVPSLPRAKASQTPLSITSVKGRFKDIMRHLKLLYIDVPAETVQKTISIIDNLGRQGYCPTGQL